MARREYKDGWHMIAGYEVYTMDGFVKRGLSPGGMTTYPYFWDAKSRCGVRYTPTAETFRRGVYAGRWFMA